MNEQGKKLRVILDTNLWISFLISRRLSKIDELFDDNTIVLIFSQELIDEFLEVAQRPKFVKYFSVDATTKLIEMFEIYGEKIDVISKIAICRDIKDNFLLALAKDGLADFLVTGDSDLLIIKTFEHTEILSYKEFEDKLY